MDKTVLKRKLLGQFLPRLGRIGLKEVAILPLTAFYPWRLFCHNHSPVFVLPYCYNFASDAVV